MKASEAALRMAQVLEDFAQGRLSSSELDHEMDEVLTAVEEHDRACINIANILSASICDLARAKFIYDYSPGSEELEKLILRCILFLRAGETYPYKDVYWRRRALLNSILRLITFKWRSHGKQFSTIDWKWYPFRDAEHFASVLARYREQKSLNGN